MAMSMKNIFGWLKLHYDKILAFVVMALLVGSLLYLAVRISTMHKDKEQFESEIRSYKPKHANAVVIDTKSFSETMANIEHPFQLESEQWTNTMVFVPERRVWCVDCRRPISYAIMKCPFCSTEQPLPVELDEKRDSDLDGMPDKWEKEHGFNPRDASDGESDFDNDGFSNLEEYIGETDAKNKDSSPSITRKLRVLSVVPDPFMFRFKSVVKLPDDSLSFGLNLRKGRLTSTYFVKLHEEIIEDEKDKARGFKVLKGPEKKGKGFELADFKVKFEEKVNASIAGVTQKVDVSVLTLQRNGKNISLVKDQDVQWNEFTAQLAFTFDNTKYTVKVDNVIELKGKKFKVISIDSKKESVLIESVNDGERTAIEKMPESRKEAPADPVKEINVKPVDNPGENPL